MRLKAAAATAALVVLLFVVSIGVEKLVVRSSSPSIAAVVAAVLVELANRDRSTGDLHTLAVSPVLQKAAQMKADDMAARGYFSHNAPDGRTPWDWFQKAGYDFRFAGENLAVYFSDSSDVEKAWMNSPSHRANILNDHFTEIGIALAHGTYQGVETTFVVQMFGSPAVASAKARPPSNIVGSSPPSGTSTVAGASAESEPLDVISEDETFIAVKKEGERIAVSPQKGKPIGALVVPNDSPQKLFWKFVTSPRTLLQYAYIAIAAVVVLSLALLIGTFGSADLSTSSPPLVGTFGSADLSTSSPPLVGIKLRRQYPVHIFYGLGLLALIGFLLYGGTALVSGHLLIL